jgi:pyridoxine kinase
VFGEIDVVLGYQGGEGIADVILDAVARVKRPILRPCTRAIP